MDGITALYKFFEDNPHALIATRPGGPKVLRDGDDTTWELWYQNRCLLCDERLDVVLRAATEEDA